MEINFLLPEGSEIFGEKTHYLLDLNKYKILTMKKNFNELLLAGILILMNVSVFAESTWHQNEWVMDSLYENQWSCIAEQPDFFFMSPTGENVRKNLNKCCSVWCDGIEFETYTEKDDGLSQTFGISMGEAECLEFMFSTDGTVSLNEIGPDSDEFQSIFHQENAFNFSKTEKNLVKIERDDTDWNFYINNSLICTAKNSLLKYVHFKFFAISNRNSDAYYREGFKILKRKFDERRFKIDSKYLYEKASFVTYHKTVFNKVVEEIEILPEYFNETCKTGTQEYKQGEFEEKSYKFFLPPFPENIISVIQAKGKYPGSHHTWFFNANESEVNFEYDKQNRIVECCVKGCIDYDYIYDKNNRICRYFADPHRPVDIIYDDAGNVIRFQDIALEYYENGKPKYIEYNTGNNIIAKWFDEEGNTAIEFYSTRYYSSIKQVNFNTITKYSYERDESGYVKKCTWETYEIHGFVHEKKIN